MKSPCLVTWRGSMIWSGARLIRLERIVTVTLQDEELSKWPESSTVGPIIALLDSIRQQAPIVFPSQECIFILTARSITPPTAGNRILTITRGSRVTLMFPALNLLASKGFFQSTSDRNAARPSRIGFDFTNKFPY